MISLLCSARIIKDPYTGHLQAYFCNPFSYCRDHPNERSHFDLVDIEDIVFEKGSYDEHIGDLISISHGVSKFFVSVRYSFQ